MATKARTERRRSRFLPEPGRVYRTGELKAWTQNPTRMAKRLVERGELRPLAHGLYVSPRRNQFGEVPPTAAAIMEAFLDHTPFVFTGPEYWNALGLGSTAVFPMQVVYNTKRSGEFIFSGLCFLLRRVKFPEQPTREWFAVDLIEHQDSVGLDTEMLARRLCRVVTCGDFDPERLIQTAEVYGTQRTQRLVKAAVEAARVTA